MPTVIELIEQAALRLKQADVAFGHGTTNAFDEAVWLVLWRLGLPIDDLEGAAVVFRPAIHADEDFQPFATGTDEEGERGRHRPEEGDQHRKIFHMVEIQSDDHRIGRHLVVTMPAPENP